MGNTNRLILALALAAAVSIDAGACGESRFRTSHTLQFRGYQSPLPATVLVLAIPGDTLVADLDTSRLARAGHRVTVVHDSEEMGRELGKASYDVVMTSYGEVAAVQQHLEPAAGSPQILPIVAPGSNEASSARSLFPNVLDAGVQLKSVLTAIDDIMSRRSVGSGIR